MKGVDYVLHQAALPSVPRSVHDPITSNDVNVTGTLNVLQAARKAGVRRLVFASSSSIYGDSPELPKQERMRPQPMSPYAISKLTGEQYCQVFWQLYGFETVCLRYFNVFGPRQDPASQYAAVIPRFITALLQGQKPTIYGDGTQSRDFTYIANVVQANLQACATPGVTGKVFNVACGERYTLLDLVTKLAEIIGRPAEVDHTHPRPGDVLDSLADITQARIQLGYEPRIDFTTGLKKTVCWFKQTNSLKNMGGNQ
jgi:nucleoside-diphosphate-sugar epimerase